MSFAKSPLAISQYLLQSDTDTYILDKIEFNLVTFMRENNLYLTNRNQTFFEVRDYYKGLPEMAHFWMVSSLNMEDMRIEHVKALVD